jgi:hypothetical protein
VDPEFRDDIIPEATLKVECFYDCLKVIDNFIIGEEESTDTDNFFVKELKERRL